MHRNLEESGSLVFISQKTDRWPHPNGKPKWQHVYAKRVGSSGFIMETIKLVNHLGDSQTKINIKTELLFNRERIYCSIVDSGPECVFINLSKFPY